MTPKTWLHTTLAALAFAAAFAGKPSEAAASPYPAYSIEVEDAGGRTLPSYAHRGQTFVLGQVGERYVIRVTNHTARRVEAVVSVDGRDVLSGDVADYESQRGYIVGPYDSVRIEGFRKSLSAVATFRFSRPGDSYSSRMGTPENVGVIGAAFFEERVLRRRRSGHVRIPRAQPKREAQYPTGSQLADRVEREASAAPAEKSSAPAPSRRSRSAAPQAEALGSRGTGSGGGGRVDYDYEYEDHSHIGTEYGEHRNSEVREVTFRRSSAKHPSRVLSLRYDDAAGLRERGIALYPSRPTPRGPEAFPLSRFAPPPPPRRY